MVIDTDGSAFITKAEFDSLKNNFQAQIDNYNSSIDSKIDGAIASYLAGIKLATMETLDYLFDPTINLSVGKVADYFNFTNYMSKSMYSVEKGNGNSNGSKDSFFDISASAIGDQIKDIYFALGSVVSDRTSLSASGVGERSLLGTLDGTLCKIESNAIISVLASISAKWFTGDSSDRNCAVFCLCPGKNTSAFLINQYSNLEWISAWENCYMPGSWGLDTLNATEHKIASLTQTEEWGDHWINGASVPGETTRNYYFSAIPGSSKRAKAAFRDCQILPTITTYADNGWIIGYTADWASSGSVYVTEKNLNKVTCFYYGNQTNVTQNTFGITGFIDCRVGGINAFGQQKKVKTNEFPFIAQRVAKSSTNDKWDVSELRVKYGKYEDLHYYSGFPFCCPTKEGTLDFNINMVDTSTSYVFMFSQEPFSQGYTETDSTATLLTAKIGASTGRKLTASGSTISVHLENVVANKPVYIKFYKQASTSQGSIKNISDISLTVAS